jgi:tetratricopeptide (TPR) repeat protein
MTQKDVDHQAVFDSLMKVKQKDQSQYEQLAKAAKSLKYFEQMKEILTKGIKVYPDNINMRLELAQSYGNIMRKLQTKEQMTAFCDLAKEQYDYLVKHDLSDHIAYCSYGKLMASFGDFTASERFFKKSLEIKPADPITRAAYKDMFCDFARKLSDARDFARAETYLKKALEIKEDDPKAHTEYGILLKSKESHYDEAEKHFLRAITLNKRYYKAHFHYSTLLLAMDNRKDAKRHLSLALKCCPPQLKDYINEGYKRMSNFDTDKSEKYNKKLK